MKGEPVMQNSGPAPYRYLVPVFAANDDLNQAQLTLKLAKAAAACGETVLMLDCQNGALMNEAGIVFNKTLADVIYNDADVRDVKYVTSNEHFTAVAAGEVELEIILGSLVALSLDYDWVFVGMPAGCTPEHVRIAGAADFSLLTFDSESDHFMRAYWMIDAVRRHYPAFDPKLVSFGNPVTAAETSQMLQKTVTDFLGGPPEYVGHGASKIIAGALLRLIRDQKRHIRVA